MHSEDFPLILRIAYS